jgi:hypothetical protein
MIPLAAVPENVTRSTIVSARIVRLRRPRAASRYANAVFQRAAVDDVHREHGGPRMPRVRVHVLEHRKADLLHGPEERGLEGAGGRRSRLEHPLGPREQGPLLAEGPSVIAGSRPPSVVVRRSPGHDALVVAGAAADDPGPRRTEISEAPVVRRIGGAARIEDVLRPTAVREWSVVGPHVHEEDGAFRLLAQSGGDHAAGRSASDHDDVDALVHAP